MAPVYSAKDNKLIHELINISQKSPKLIKGSDYVAPEVPEMTIRSWKMNEFKYYDVPSPFPTLARGLFTTEVDEGRKRSGKEKEYRIVIRGYDKFFNIGEVPWTTWDSLEAHTAAPYSLSLKSNGCIIFIAALTPTKLLITSKHSLGPISNVARSHSQVGEEWLHKHLAKVEKTTEQLAAALWEKNWTAVAELCDDDFEEHVLPYPPEKSGLHLHGINENTRDFRTQPTDIVDKFADEWGFIKTKTTVLNSIQEVRDFTTEVGKTGKWEGEALEGFVVRTQVTGRPTDGRHSVSLSPYEPGSSFFFKVKFDEPYMMYRDWREVTKILLGTKGPLSDARLPKAKLKLPETKLYVKWIKAEIGRDRGQFENFNKGKGIIATRERFLKWMETSEAKEVAADEDASTPNLTFGKTIILPIAVPGAGKTSVSVALERLFGFGHTQSDDVKSKKAAPQFIRNVQALLKKHDVVIADKNNHLRQHRMALRDAVRSYNPPVRLLALNWAFEQPLATIHRICSDRVYDRGGKHQTLHADVRGKSHEDVIWQFLEQREELEEHEVDAVIEMDITEDIEQALDRAVDGCVRILGLEKPEQEKVGLALAAARGYEPTRKEDRKEKEKEKKKSKPPRYYGFVPEIDLLELLNPVFTAGGNADVADGKQFFTNLKKSGRIAKQPHVTIVHSKSLDSEWAQPLWDRCSELYLSSAPSTFRLTLGSVVWNDLVMAVTVDEVMPTSGDEAGESFVEQLPEQVRKKLHITIGTTNKDIQPFEAQVLVGDWRDGRHTKSLQLTNIPTEGRIRGLFS
ncbi:RNA ligase [Thelephora ganbajun]|uniref:RNA ligase n=1 Tax=Thelephora ganbajun TaxID=370292 RepID=A0ACB6ZS76_THEGA|nr:RNA ligase [Thelephora ganbajun]